MATPADGDEEGTFEEMGLDPRLLRALSKRGIQRPTLVQAKCIPLALGGKDIVARARTGSGKTLAYLLPLLQNLLSGSATGKKPSGLVLVPTRELCQQVHDEVVALAGLCGGTIAVCLLAQGMSAAAMKAALLDPPDILLATPGRISACLRDGLLTPSMLQEGLSMLVLDEADLLLTYGYEDDVRQLAVHVPRRAQCLLMLATASPDLERLKKLVLHNPVVLTLREVEGSDVGAGLPDTLKQFAIRCAAQDKLLNMLALLRLNLVPQKVLIFVDSIDAGFRLRLFLEHFGIHCAVLNSELPLNSRLHVLQDFNRGAFDYLIATDEGTRRPGKRGAPSKGANARKEHSEEAGAGEVEEVEAAAGASGRDAAAEKVGTKRKDRGTGGNDEDDDAEDGAAGPAHGVESGLPRGRHKDQKVGPGEYGVVRGIDFKNVHTVINFDMASTATDYVHRVGRTGRAGMHGMAISLVSPAEEPLLAAVEAALGSSAGSVDTATPAVRTLGRFAPLTANAVEALRYRGEDVARSITRLAVREARASELRLEMLNSERLKAHFEDNPTDLDLLKHDKALSKIAPAPHLKAIPSYLRDPTAERRNKALKAAKVGSDKSRQFAKKRFQRNRADAALTNPLKGFSFKGNGKMDEENPEVAAALAGTQWARDKERKKGSSKHGAKQSAAGGGANKYGKFQSSRKQFHRRKR